jgi:hypothetical protein
MQLSNYIHYLFLLLLSPHEDGDRLFYLSDVVDIL